MGACLGTPHAERLPAPTSGLASSAQACAAHPSAQAPCGAVRCSAAEPKLYAESESLSTEALSELPQHEEVLLRLKGVDEPLHANKVRIRAELFSDCRGRSQLELSPQGL